MPKHRARRRKASWVAFWDSASAAVGAPAAGLEAVQRQGGQSQVQRRHAGSTLQVTGPLGRVCEHWPCLWKRDRAGVSTGPQRSPACVQWQLLLTRRLLGSVVTISDMFAGHCPGYHTGLAQPGEHVGPHCTSMICFSRCWISSGLDFFFSPKGSQNYWLLWYCLVSVYLLSKYQIQHYFTSEGCISNQLKEERKLD